MKHILTATALSLAAIAPASAARFFSTAPAEKFIQVGVRAGINSSTQSINRNAFPNWTSSGWGTGFQVGVEVPLAVFDFLSFQPGLYYQLRSGDYAISSSPQTGRMGHYTMSYITFPIMVQVNFNVSDRLRWGVEAGPYFSWRFGSSHSDASIAPVVLPEGVVPVVASEPSVGSGAKQKKDYGLKVGTFFLLNRRWYAGLHYYAGMTRVYNDKALGGSNMEWSLSIGYNF